MKKLLIITILGFALLSACAESPGIEDSTLPQDWALQKAREKGSVVILPEEKNVAIPEDKTGAKLPSGDYILLKNLYQSNLVEVSLYLRSSKVCTWEDPISPPWDFQIPQDNLYFVEENCPGLGETVISWYIFENLGIDSQNNTELSVWRVTGSQYFLLPVNE